MRAGWVSKNLADDHKACLWGLPVMHSTHDANRGEHFLQYIVTGDERFVHHMTLKTSMPSLMWKQPLSTTEKGIQSYAISEKDRVSVL